MAKPTDVEIEEKRAIIAEAREQALQAKADIIRVKARNKAENIRKKADGKAKMAIAKGEARAAKIEGITPAEIERKIRLDVHGRPKPAMRGWIHAVATPLALAAGIVLICLAHGTGLKWACAVFMTCSLVLFGNSACYHLGDWSPRVTDVLRRIDHMNIFLLIAGTYTPVSFALEPFWRNSIIAGMWICTTVALIIHVIWISAPRWLYVIVYIIFGVPEWHSWDCSGFRHMPVRRLWCCWPQAEPAISPEPSYTRYVSPIHGRRCSASMRFSIAAPLPVTHAIWWRSTW